MTGFRQIATYLESEGFRNELVEACKTFEILSEADLQVFVAGRLTKLLKDDPALNSKYRVNSEPFSRALKCFPDIAIFHRHARSPHEPSFAIELKQGHSFGAAVEHDCKKLLQYRDRIGVRRAYLIHLAHSGTKAEFDQKLASTKGGMRNVSGVGVAMSEELENSYDKWHSERRALVRAFQPKKAKGAAAI